jgi:predicted AlkP superfamily phosphohydrolase/phosphomutase/cytochrome c-type biogenesis protein CcmH/NrfG
VKRARLIFVALAALGLLAGAAGLRRVPGGEEGLRISRDGSVSVVRGWTYVGPGASLVRYPSGEQSYRIPAVGSASVLFEEGDSLGVAFEVGLSIPAGASVGLERGFSREFVPAFRRLVVAAAEIEAAGSRSSRGPEEFGGAVAGRVRDEMAGYGITVGEVRVVQWGDRRMETGGERRRLLIVGVDGGDWANLAPLMEAGRLPNFARLKREGTTGVLRSEEPMLSPLLWTTMATGREPEEHGVLDFFVVDAATGTRVPVGRQNRKVDAFWNMLGDAGRSVSIVGWLATDPAESINGVMVTDKFGYLAYAPKDTAQAEATSLYPRERWGEMKRLVVEGREVSDAEMLRFVHVTAGELARHRGEFDAKDPVNALMHLYASTQTFKRIALHVWETDRPEVEAVYFEWVDAVSHLFMLHTPPRAAEVSEEDFARYRDAVEEAYVVQDEILGEIMGKMDAQTVLMVVSDHGFKSGESRLKNRPEIWAGNAAEWHRLTGMVGLMGAGVKRGAEIQGASIIDVAPTVLAVMGLPRAEDMPGKAMRAAFTDEEVARFSTQSVPTLDRAREPVDPGAVSSASKETMAKLEALGYLAPDNADALNNLGQRWEQRGEYAKAIEQYQQAIALRPNFYSAYNNLAVCYGRLKQYPQAEAALKKCVALKPDDVHALNNLAVMMLETKRIDEGIPFAERAVKVEPGYATARVTLGALYVNARRYDDAEREFKEALRLEPDNGVAKENLKRLAAVRGGQ